MQRWFMYRLPHTGSFYANGPLPASSIRDARRRLAELFQVVRLPRGTEVWETDRRTA